MKKILLTITVILLAATSFRFTNREKWIATFDIFTTEDGQIVVYYRGDIHECDGKKMIDYMFQKCDTMGIMTKGKDTVPETETDSCMRRNKIDKIKTNGI